MFVFEKHYFLLFFDKIILTNGNGYVILQTGRQYFPDKNELEACAMNAKKLLTIISFAITAVTFAVIAVLFIRIDELADLYLRIVDKLTPERLSSTILYGRIALGIAAAALLTLLRLLFIVRGGQVFSAETKHIITLLSLFCFGETLLFVILGTHFLLSYVVAFAALMLGLLLLVLRCVMAEAIEIKSENDYTV